MKDSNFLKENNARYLWHPMAHPADSQANPPDIIVEAEGVELVDVDGHRSVDAVGGLWNVNLGYSCDPVKEAIAGQLNKLPYYSIFRGTSNDAVIELSCMLREFFGPDGLSRAFFTCGGSDSVEVSLRLARQYHKIRGEGGRVKFLSLKKGYHGTHTLGASVNGNANFRTQYEPLMQGCYHIPAPYTYRNPYKSFMPGVREVCNRYGILLIADEVICAFGRTGSWSGSRHWGVQPDMLCCAKAITNGYFPFGAVMIAESVAEVFEQDTSGKAAIGSGYTYSGHPVGAAAAIACLKETNRLQIKDNAAARGVQLFAGLQALQEKHGAIGDVRGGHGLMCALELVADRGTKAPIDKETIGKVHRVTYENGSMIRVSGNNIILSPPLVVSGADVDTILSALDAGFAAVS